MKLSRWLLWDAGWFVYCLVMTAIFGGVVYPILAGAFAAMFVLRLVVLR